MRRSLKTFGPYGRIDNFFSIYSPWDDRSVLGAKQLRGHSFIMILFAPIKSLTAYGAYAAQTGAILTKTKVPFKDLCGRFRRRVPGTSSRTADMQRLTDVVTLFAGSSECTPAKLKDVHELKGCCLRGMEEGNKKYEKVVTNLKNYVILNKAGEAVSLLLA